MLKSKLAHITTPIFYPNAKPHLGHLYSSVICDVQNRWNKLQGYETKFTTGTDEHGLKIQNAALLANVAPKKFVDRLALDFQKMDHRANIDYTRFIRTTDPDHVVNVEKLWNLCSKYIYKGQHKGWYSVSDETFYPESQIVEVLPDGKELPFDSAKFNQIPKSNWKSLNYINTESRNKVVYQSETNYFFQLSAFQQPLIEYIRAHPGFIKPEKKRQDVLKILEEQPLQDLSISRPSSRLQWAIGVPGDTTQKVYVWFDALCNYITSIGEIQSFVQSSPSPSPSQQEASEKNKLWWKNTTHVIGKDIVKFHCIYWPAFLMAANIGLPREIVVHGHWLSEGVKMSKSLGNVVDPIAMIEHYGADSLRWYVLENSSIEHDGDFIEESLYTTRQSFVGKWGNLINRCCSPKFDLQRAVSKYAGNFRTLQNGIPQGALELFKDEKEKELYKELIDELQTFPKEMNEFMTLFNYQHTLKRFWKILNDANNFVQYSEPWKCSARGVSPQEDQAVLDRQDFIVYVGCETSRILSILAQPFIPELSVAFLKRLGVTKNELHYAQLGKDSDYGFNCNVKGNVPITRVEKRESCK
ncbi:hypothetical protein ACO0QE_001735 [Hanseniaspora vineae]